MDAPPSRGTPDPDRATAAPEVSSPAPSGDSSTGDARCGQVSTPVPGDPLYSTDATGTGACAGITVEESVAAVHAAHPELADIATLYDPRGGISDGTYVYAFRRPDGTLALAFKRGSGDCQSGCIRNEVWYFEADATCTLQQVGHTDTGLACIPADEQPRWGIPGPVDPARLCGFDPAPRTLPSQVTLAACGSLESCHATPTATGSVRLTIVQATGDLAHATVTLTDTGLPELEGKSFPAAVTASRLHAEARTSNLPASCEQSDELRLEYDFGTATGHVSYFGFVTPDCAGAPMTSCKVGLDALLGPVAAE